MTQRNQNGGNGNNRNSQGTNRQQKLVMNVKSSSQIIGDTCEVSFEVSVFRGLSPVIGQIVILKDGVARITNGNTEVPTDTGGIAILKVVFDLKDQEQHKVLRICLDGLPDEVSYPVELPKKENKSGPKESSEKLLVMKYQKDNGEVTFKARVLDTDGSGVPKKIVKLFFKGNDKKKKTDSEGEVLFTLPKRLSSGEETEIFFTVSGVNDVLRMTLRRKRPLKQAKALSRGWWLGVNNGRALCVLLAALFFWILAISIGPGRPIFSEGLFSGQSGLSPAQIRYNETAADGYAIKPVDRSEDYVFGNFLAKKSLWKIALILTFAFLIYFPIAAREEIADAIDDIKLKMVDRNIVKVKDPFFERLVASASSMGIIGGNKGSEAQFGPVSSSSMGANPNDKDGDGKKDKKTFGSSFLSYLSLDLVTDLVLGIIKRVFR
ncbi:hypothetical protein JXK06_03420 [Patescibacteria group bacterium]|nr:hypothetical protein [Patescibacteria group bacterium]